MKNSQKLNASSDVSTYMDINTQKNENSSRRRGRKRERDDLYFIRAQERITELKEVLKTAKEDGLTVTER